jgi:hypothetical protein
VWAERLEISDRSTWLADDGRRSPKAQGDVHVERRAESRTLVALGPEEQKQRTRRPDQFASPMRCGDREEPEVCTASPWEAADPA